MSAAAWARACATAGYLGLLGLLVAWHVVATYVAPSPVGPVLFLAAAVLVLPLPGLLRGSIPAHVAGAFLALGAFAHGVVEAWSAVVHPLWGGAEIVLSLLAFWGAALYIRLARRPRARLTPDPSPGNGG